MVKKTVKKKTTGKKPQVKNSPDKKSETKDVSVADNKVSNSSKAKEKFNADLGLKVLKIAIPFVLILFVMWFAFYVRSGPIDLDGMDKRIEQNIYSNIKGLIAQQVAEEYPNLNDAYKQELVDKRYAEVVKTGIYELNGQKYNVDDLVAQNSKSVKDAFKADNGQTYLNAIDPYYFLKSSANYYFNGHTGDKLILDDEGNEVSLVTYRMAPVQKLYGSFMPEFHIHVESFFFSLYGIDENSNIGDMTKAVFLIPVIFVMLSVIPIYLILRKYSNDLFAFFGSILLVSIGTFISRTVAGFVDTDAYNVFFSLMVVLFLVYGLSLKNKILRYLFLFLSGLFQMFFIWAWASGWYIFVFVCVSLVGYGGYLALSYFMNLRKEVNNIKMNLLSVFVNLLIFVTVSFLSILIFLKRNIFEIVFGSIFKNLTSLASISQSYIWPNVVSSVAELNPASFGQVINSVGGKFVFLIAFVGLLFLTIDFISKNKEYDIYKKLLILFGSIWFLFIIFGRLFVNLTANHPLLFLVLLFLPIGIGLVLSLFNNNVSDKIFLSMLLGIWMGGTIYMSFNGVRFILLLAPAFAISFALGLFYLSKIINVFITTEFGIKNLFWKNVYGFVFVTIVFIIMFMPMKAQAIAISEGTTPNFDDAWYSTMYKIRDNSAEDAIITSWWDFGHFFTLVADRGITFDGGSQMTPRSHWVGRLLMENDEQVSIDILRMLVCGGNEAHNTMLSFTEGKNKDAVKVNKIIYETLGKNKSETRRIVEENKYYSFTSEQVDEVMEFLYCDEPRENFLITSEDMVGKAGVWAHWGSWDFTRKYVYDNYKKKSADEITLDIDENVTLIEKYIDELKTIDVKAQAEDIKREDLVNQWFAPYPSYIPLQGKYAYSCKPNSNVSLICQNGIGINFETGKVSSSFGEGVVFKRLVVPSRSGEMEVFEQDVNGDIDVLLMPSAQGYSVMLMQYPLGGSLFTKLFYLGGFGTEHFELFDNVQSMTGVKVVTWKVLWNGAQEEVIEIEVPMNATLSE